MSIFADGGNSVANLPPVSVLVTYSVKERPELFAYQNSPR